MSASKKRPIDEGSFNDVGDVNMTARKQRLKVSSPNKKAFLNSEFVLNKKCLFQQGMEDLNEKAIKGIAQITNPDEMALAALDYLRVEQDLQRLYNPRPGLLMSMGNDDCFQLGVSQSADADKETDYPPTFVRINASTGSKVVQVAGGGLHSVALTEDGQVYTFGCNDDCALGREVADESMLHLISPVTNGFTPQDHNQIIAVDAGDSHSLFLSIHGNVYQCGMYKDMDSGKFSDKPVGSSASPKGSNKIPVLVPLQGKAKEIRAGESWNAAIMEDDTLVTWGMGHNGQLARSKNMGTKLIENSKGHKVYDLGKLWIGEEYWTGEYEKDDKNEIKIDEKTGERIKEISYRYHNDLIKEKFLTPGPVCWDNPPVIKRTVLSVACGDLHMLVAARDDGFDSKIYSSGNNGFGQLGHGDQRERHELTSIKSLERKMITKVAAGSKHSLALTICGTAMYGWGRSDYGQIGHSDKVQGGDQEESPQQIAFPSSMEGKRIRDIVAGPLISMAISEDNDVYTWGFVESGATGHMLENDILRPKKLKVLKKKYARQGTNCHVLSASGGGCHSLMVIERFS